MKNEGGSALIEIVIAVSIFAVCALGLSNSVLAARKTGDSSRQAGEAATLAYDKIEHLRTLLPISSELTAGSHADPQNPLRSDTSPGGIFTRTWTIVGSLPIPGMRRVVMTVTWPDHGRTGSVTLVTYML